MVEGATLLLCALDAGAEVEAVFVGTPDDGSWPPPAVVDVLARAQTAGIRVYQLGPGVV